MHITSAYGPDAHKIPKITNPPFSIIYGWWSMRLRNGKPERCLFIFNNWLLPFGFTTQLSTAQKRIPTPKTQPFQKFHFLSFLYFNFCISNITTLCYKTMERSTLSIRWNELKRKILSPFLTLALQNNAIIVHIVKEIKKELSFEIVVTTWLEAA